MATEQSYYVPHNSRLPIFASLGIFLTLYGAGHLLNDMTAGKEQSIGTWILPVGGLVMAGTLYAWFNQVIKENHARLYNDQMNRSYVWSMSWFIFSEVMFFLAFFGALFYIRVFVVDWLPASATGVRAVCSGPSIRPTGPWSTRLIHHSSPGRRKPCNPGDCRCSTRSCW